MTVKDYGSSAQQPANVQVIAPATLNAGYTFDASYEGNTFTVTVPEGGVVKGQRFIVPYIPPAVAAEGTPIITGAPLLPLYSPNMRGTGEYRIPTGAWRDSLCDCFKFGPCHPSLLTACCCRPILVAQLLTRMKMTWLGQRTHVRTSTSANLSDSRTEVDQRWKSTFRNILLVLVLCIVLLTVVFPAPPMEDPTDPDAYDNLSVEEQRNLTINKLLSALFAFYFFYLLVQLRATLRHVYSIPEQSCLCLYCGSNPSDGIFAVVMEGTGFVRLVSLLDGKMSVVPCAVLYVLQVRWRDILWIMIIGGPRAAIVWVYRLIWMMRHMKGLKMVVLLEMEVFWLCD